jgi:GH25 family lysozyme M1 (1,4-beta-N-acetylmuramidase)
MSDKIKGIDVSHYQGNIDFSKVKNEGVLVVFIKATDGKTYKDPNFKINYDNAKANDLLVGAYHFLRGNSVEDEVENFLSVVGALDFDCKLVIDAEVNLGSVDITSKQVKGFCDLLKSQEKEVVLYTGDNFYKTNLNDSIKDIPLWIARYSESKPEAKNYIGWQYTSSGSVDGISGRVDLNEFTEDILINKNISPEAPKRQTNEEILNLQKVLNKLKIRDGKGNALAEDGILGKYTIEATKRLQSICGISIDGVAGQQTWNTINIILNKQLLRLGSTGIAVRYMQYRVGANYDGVFGNATRASVIKFQQNNSLSGDGIVGLNTWSKIFN